MLVENGPTPDLVQLLNKQETSQRPWIIICSITFVIGLVLILITLLQLRDGYDEGKMVGGYLLSIISFMVISSILVQQYRSKKYKKIILSGKTWLHWVYSPEEMKQVNQKNWDDWRKGFRISVIVFGFFLALVDAAIVYYLRSKFIEGPLVLLGSAALFVAYGVIARLIFRDRKNKSEILTNEPVHLFISKMGIYWSNSGFTSFEGKLAEIKIEKNQNEQPDLVITTLASNSRSIQNNELLNWSVSSQIPLTTKILIPQGKQNEAENIVQHFSQGTLIN